MVSTKISLILVVLISLFAFCANQQCESESVKKYSEEAIARQCETVSSMEATEQIMSCYHRNGLHLRMALGNCGDPCDQNLKPENATAIGCCVTEYMITNSNPKLGLEDVKNVEMLCIHKKSTSK